MSVSAHAIVVAVLSVALHATGTAAAGPDGGDPVRGADTAPWFARGTPATFASRMPCLEDECFGTIEVRRADGHLCHEPTGGLPCPDYSSGVRRYVDVMLRAVALRLGLPQPPPLAEETRVFAAR